MLNQINPNITPFAGTGNPALDAIHALPEPSKQALSNAHSQVINQIQSQMGGGVPGIQATPEASQVASPQLPQIAAPRQHVPTLGPTPMNAAPYQAEYQRLTDPNQESSKSGINQIHNPWARIPLQILDAVGTTFAPRLVSALPGTQLHHNQLVNEQAANIGQVATEANDAQKRGLEAAQTDLANARPEIESLKQENAMTRAQMADDTKHAQLAQKTQNDSLKAQISSLNKGLTVDENGHVAVDPNNPVTKKLQAQEDYINAQRGVADATAQLRAAQAEGEPRKIAIAEQRLDVERQRIAQAAQNIGLRAESLDLAKERFFNPQPSGAQRTKADLGQSMKLQISTMKDIIQRHPEFFGPGAGRLTSLQAWMGSQDPDAQRFLAAQNFMAEHGSGMFGSRNKHVIDDIKNLGRVSMNTPALLASLDQADKTADEFVTAGTVHHTPQGVGSTAPSGGTTHFNVGGTDYDIPNDKVEAFKKAKGLK